MSDDSKFDKAKREFSDLKAEGRRLQSQVACLESELRGADALMADAVAMEEAGREEAISNALDTCAVAISDLRQTRAREQKALVDARETLAAVRKKMEARSEKLHELLNDDIRNQ